LNLPNPGVARSIRAEGTNKNKGLYSVISWLAPFFMRIVLLDIALFCLFVVSFDIEMEQEWNKNGTRKMRDLRDGTHSNSQGKK
jgi:hypothetical protein